MNQKMILIFLFSTLILLSGCIDPKIIGNQNQMIQTSTTQIQPFFCSHDPCESAVLNELNQAQASVHVAMYSFTLDSFAEKLIELKQKGIEVKVLMEKQQLGESSEFEKLKRAGIEVKIDSNPNLMHNKFCVIDGKTVLNGSMNWTGNGVNENNENFLIIHSEELAGNFESEFESLFAEGKIQ